MTAATHLDTPGQTWINIPISALSIQKSGWIWTNLDFSGLPPAQFPAHDCKFAVHTQNLAHLDAPYPAARLVAAIAFAGFNS